MKRRWNLVELEDFAWFPRWLRDPATDYLKFLAVATGSYEPAVVPLARLLRACDENRILDLCSGGGGGLLSILPAVEKIVAHSIEVVFTDKYPNLGAGKNLPRAHYSERSVDATEVPADLNGLRTLFTAIHHFNPASIRRIAEDAARRKIPVAIFDATQRQWNVFWRIPLVAAGVFLATPFLRPFSWSRLFWTYVIPLVPLLVLFDGSMSCLRSYRADELEGIVQDTGGPEYHWRGFIRTRPGWLFGGDVTCLLGAPINVDLRLIAESESET